METFTDAATTDGQEPAATVINTDFNKAAEEAPMTAEAAPAIDTAEPVVFESAQELAINEKLSDEAFAAVKRGDLTRMRELLDMGLSVNVRDDKGFTLLMHAAQENQTEAGKELLIREADPEARNDAGLTAMMLAATAGNVDIARILLDEMEDDDLDNDDDISETLALQHGHYGIVRLIEERRRRADFNASADDEKKHHRKHHKRSLALSGFEDTAEGGSSEAACARDSFAIAADLERLASEGQTFGMPHENAVVHAAKGVGHFISGLCHSASDKWSRFWQHSKDGDTCDAEVPTDAAQMDPNAKPPIEAAKTPDEQANRFTKALSNILHDLGGV